MGDIFSHNRSDQDSLVDLTHVQASKRLKHMLTVKEHFANRWRLEYVSQLRLFNHQKTRNVSEGDVLLIVDAKKKISNWSLGLVTKTFLGRDNRIRVVEVKIGKTHFLRSVHSLLPLEFA